MMEISFERHTTIEEFRDLKDEWIQLHSSSGQSVFTSWFWMYAWWQSFNQKDYELCIISCRSKGVLVGVLPFYISSDSFLRFLSVRRIRFLGDGHGYRAEYLDFIFAPSVPEACYQDAIQFLLQIEGVDELYLNSISQSLSRRLPRPKSIFSSFYCRETALDQTYQVDVDRSYESFVKEVGKGTRYRINTSEKRLNAQGQLIVESVENFESSGMQNLQAGRWENQELFSDYERFLEKLKQESVNGELDIQFNRMMFQEQIIGASLNVQFGRVIYNLMLGFRELNIKRVSPGLLVLAKDIQGCCESDVYTSYDLLAGTGKHSNYKEKIAEAGEKIVSVQVLVAPFIRLIYTLYDRYKIFKRGRQSYNVYRRKA